MTTPVTPFLLTEEMNITQSNFFKGGGPAKKHKMLMYLQEY